MDLKIIYIVFLTPKRVLLLFLKMNSSVASSKLISFASPLWTYNTITWFSLPWLNSKQPRSNYTQFFAKFSFKWNHSKRSNFFSLIPILKGSSEDGWIHPLPKIDGWNPPAAPVPTRALHWVNLNPNVPLHSVLLA